MQGDKKGFDALEKKIDALIDVETAARALLQANPQLHQQESGKALAAALVRFEKA